MPEDQSKAERIKVFFKRFLSIVVKVILAFAIALSMLMLWDSLTK